MRVPHVSPGWASPRRFAPRAESGPTGTSLGLKGPWFETDRPRLSCPPHVAGCVHQGPNFSRSRASRVFPLLSRSIRHALAAALLWSLSGPPRLAVGAEAPPAPDVLGAVEGIPIRQEQFDRLAQPYFEEVRAKVNRDLTPEEKKLLNRNVLEELIRERLWISAARRQGLSAPAESVDARMRRLPYFQTGGKLDEAKFQAFKASPTSNYRQVAAELTQTLLLEEYTRWMEHRFAPAEADLKREFAMRTTQGTIRYFWLTPEAVSLDRPPTRAAVRAYYDGHPEQFRTPAEARLVYLRLGGPADAGASDSVRAAADEAAAAEARDLLRQLAGGASLDQTARGHGGVNDTGWFRIGDPVRGLGRSQALMDAIEGKKPGEWTSEPVRIGPYTVIARVEERREPRLRPFYESVPLAKRGAEQELEEARLDSLGRLEYRRRPGEYRVPRLTAVAVIRSLASFDDGRTPRDRDVRRAFERIRQEAGVPDTNRAYRDSVMALLPAALRAERAREAAWKAMRDAAKRLKRGQRPEEVAGRAKADLVRISLYRGEPPLHPSVVQGAFLDSLYAQAGGTVVGPRASQDSVYVVKVLEVDPTFLPPYDAVRARARDAVEAARQEDEAQAAEAWFQTRRDTYKTPERWVFDYVFFRKSAPESIPIPVDTLQAYWERHPLEFTVPGEVHARHILFATRGADAARKEAQRAKAAEILKRIRGGEDFASLARELSDDRGSAERGGDLGWISRADVVPDFAKAAFALEAGQTSDVVETEYGYHIIRIDDKRPQKLRPFDDCRGEIQRVLGEDRADSLAIQAARAFADAASRTPAGFDSLALPYGGALLSPPVASGQTLTGVGALENVGREIGSLQAGGVTRSPIPLTGGYLVARMDHSVPPGLASFDEVRDRVIRDRNLTLRRAVADSIDAVLRSALSKGGDLDSLLVRLGGLRPSKPFGPRGPIPDLARDPAAARDSSFLARVFSSKAGAVLPPLTTALGTVYSVVDTIIPAPPSEFAKARASLRREILDERVETWTDRLRSRARIEIYRKELRS
jgi:parvulin-like peptidyl-prolyl isomerase